MRVRVSAISARSSLTGQKWLFFEFTGIEVSRCWWCDRTDVKRFRAISRHRVIVIVLGWGYMVSVSVNTHYGSQKQFNVNLIWICCIFVINIDNINQNLTCRLTNLVYDNNISIEYLGKYNRLIMFKNRCNNVYRFCIYWRSFTCYVKFQIRQIYVKRY